MVVGIRSSRDTCMVVGIHTTTVLCVVGLLYGSCCGVICMCVCVVELLYGSCCGVMCVCVCGGAVVW